MSNLSREEQAHLQQLVRDLIQGDSKVSAIGDDAFDQTPYIIKQIFQSGKQDAFGELLSAFSSKKEAEIEKVCSLHYQEFVGSIDQLLKVRAGTSLMRDKILKMNQIIQESGVKTIAKKQELIEHRKKLLNIELALETVQSCLFVLDITNRVSSQIENRKYFSALRMIQEIQSTHLKLTQTYSFSKLIVDWIPKIQDNVRSHVIQEIKEWYAIIKESSARVGKLAMDLTLKRHEKITKIINDEPSIGRKNKSSLSSVKFHNSMELALSEDLGSQGEMDDIQLDFTPLFQCIHIHEVLGKRTQLKIDYEENRRLQADQIIQQSFTLKSGNTKDFKRYIQQIAGFFVIEATVMTATQEFRSRSNVEAIWDLATNKLGAHLIESLSECTMPELFLEMKEYITAFIQTMSVYGYAVSHLSDLMLSLLDRFGELIRTETVAKISSILNEEDDYTPISVETKEILQEINIAVSIPPDYLKTLQVPCSLPFSTGIPKSVSALTSMIDRFYRFASGFTQQSNEIDDLLKKVLESVIQSSIIQLYKEKLGNADLSIAIQIMINSQWLAHSCSKLEIILQEKRCARRGSKVTLLAAQAFEEIFHHAEARIFIIINSKIDKFIDIIDYDWKSPVAKKSYNPVFKDLTDFIEAISGSALMMVPESTKSKVYFEAFDHLSSLLKKLITSDPKITYINTAALMSLEKDVEYLDSFVKKLEDAVADSFIELRQLILYGKSGNYEEILNVSIKNKKYSRVQIPDVIGLLEKLKNYDTGYFSKATQEEKQTKRMIEDVLKVLRS